MASAFPVEDACEAAENLLAALVREPLIPVRASFGEGAVQAEFRKAPPGESLRLLSQDDAGRVEALSSIVRFLPQRHWTRTHTEILLDELRKGSARALAIVPAGSDGLVSYLDYEPPAGDEVEIGFCMTHPDWRRRGLMTRLMATAVCAFFGFHMLVTTSQSNTAMQRTLLKLGFRLKEYCPDDRTNGEATLVFARAAATPFDLAVPTALAG